MEDSKEGGDLKTSVPRNFFICLDAFKINSTFPRIWFLRSLRKPNFTMNTEIIKKKKNKTVKNKCWFDHLEFSLVNSKHEISKKVNEKTIPNINIPKAMRFFSDVPEGFMGLSKIC